MFAIQKSVEIPSNALGILYGAHISVVILPYRHQIKQFANVEAVIAMKEFFHEILICEKQTIQS